MLVERIYEYGKSVKALDEKARLIVFNCAEYAENPQLILAQLFGYKKGAFTGADRDSEGLVEKADGGVLFLDEIHRLPRMVRKCCLCLWIGACIEDWENRIGREKPMC